MRLRIKPTPANGLERELDVGVYPLRTYYWRESGKPGLLFGYGAIEERDIVEGLSRLRRAFPN